MKRILAGLIALAAGLATAPAARAQGGTQGLSLEVNGGAAIPALSFGANEGANTGLGFSANAVYAFTPVLRAYVGYNHGYLPCDNAECGSGAYVSSGAGAGGELALVRPGSRVTAYPWLRAGVLLNRLQHDTPSGVSTVRRTSEIGAGFEVRGGVAIPVNARVTLLPGVGYSLYRAEFDGMGTVAEKVIDVRMVGADVSLRVHL